MNTKRILTHILSYEVKKYDAPCSADTQLNQAIHLLLQESNDTTGFTTENLEHIEEALEEMKLLGRI